MRQLLKDIAEITAGQGAPQGDSNYSDDGIPFVKAGNLQELIEGKPLCDIQKVSEDVAKSHHLKLFPQGTVLFAKSGMSCLKGYIYVLPSDAYVVNHLACILPKEDFSDYLKYYFIFHKPNKLVKDAAYPSISLTDIGNLEIDVKNYQKRDIVVRTLQKLDEIIKIRKQQLTNLDYLIKARFVEMFGDPMNCKKRWVLSNIGKQFLVTSGGTPSTENKAYWENGTIPWIGSNMCQNAILYKNDGKFITEEGYSHSSAKLLYSGTVLIALVGATIGKTALLRFDTTTNQNVAAIDVNNNDAFTSEFIFYHLQFQYGKFMEIGNGKFKMANQGFIRQLPLICPPIELQNEFSTFVEQVDKSKVAVQKALDEAQLLFDSLMQEYFG